MSTVRRSPEGQRYEIVVDDVVAGFAQYVDREQRRIFFHTEVSPEYGGRGLATRLVEEALAATMSEGMTIVPVCPLVRAYVAKHDAFDASIGTPQPKDLAAIDER